MLEEGKLYQELYRLREMFKEQSRRTEGRASLVCTDDALVEIVKLKPKKISDFEGVKGIGDTFIKRYATEFLNVISKYQSENEKEIQMKQSVVKTMKELEKKLVNINKRNRLLSLNSLVNKYAFDMYPLGDTIIDKLIYSQAKVKLCDIDHPVNGIELKEEVSKQKKLVTLLRETNKDLREKGQNDLYIGYPFVIGRLPGEAFDVHAPLVLFPVVEERTPSYISVELDESRDIVYNNTLLLAYYKFNKLNEPLHDEAVEVRSKNNFISDVLDFYKEKGLNINPSFEGLSKFNEYKVNEFPKFVSGELNLEMNAILGKFPICSSSIQKDFDQMIEEKKCNGLVESLLEDSLPYDFYSNNYENESPNQLTEAEQIINESKLVYINELNSSQEAVLNAIEKRDKIVVQGPPGTGKSQTIASLIANFVNKGKTVLMVSEKKTALDVVYSRLGDLSKYALLIDDVGNKNLFYEQLKNMLYFSNAFNTDDVNLDNISFNIDNQVSKLESIASKLYMMSDFRIEQYKLYLINRKYNFNNQDEYNLYKTLKEKWENKSYLLNAKYQSLVKTTELFNNSENINKCAKYIELYRKYPFMNKMVDSLVGFEVNEFLEEIGTLKSNIDEWNNKNFVVKLFTKGKVIKEIKNNLSKYFLDSSKEMIKLLFKEIDKVYDSINYYCEFFDTKLIYSKLSNLEIEYLLTLYDSCLVLNIPYQEMNKELFNALIHRQIELFEKNNKDVLNSIANFDSIFRNISLLISKKQKLTKAKLEHLLRNHIKELSTSKRQSEIRRAVESKRRWSVNKFTKKFGFELFKGVNIWLLTPEVVSEIIPLDAGIFDLVIFDEASQMYVEKGIPSILRGKKVIVAGDQKQLRPSSLGSGRTEIDLDELDEDEEVEAALEEESLLDLARFKYCDVLLNFHYRSKYEELIAFSNYAFYNGRLYVSPNASTPPAPPIEVHKLEDGMWQNRSNIKEAKHIVELLKKFFKERTNNETIGIITFNTNQRDLIDDLIDEECAINPEFRTQVMNEQKRKKDGEDIGLFVKNIENVQGDERDAIIFSIGYAKNEKGRVVTRFGWLNQKGGENRLNVAISRAKEKIYIVTSIVPSDLVVEGAKNDGPRIFKKYLEYAYAISNNDSETAKQILLSFGDQQTNTNTIQFDSEFENEVYIALAEKGFEVDTQVGIGGYRIDLAIKQDGKYILGIECDGKLYHSSKIARERDIHRQKYLESRGWRIHRIWSTNWWNNKEKEIEKICEVVKHINK